MVVALYFRYGLKPMGASMRRPASSTLTGMWRAACRVILGVATGVALGVSLLMPSASGALASGLSAEEMSASAPPTTDPATTDPAAETTVDDGGGDDEDSGDVGTVSGGGTGDTVPVTLPLVPVPVGCTAPVTPHVVFVGEVIDRDVRTVRFRVESVRAGRLDPFVGDGRIDVRYGLDAQYLDDGERYLVSAVVDPDLGVLVSRVTEPIEHFGGDEVIGVSESDVDCPAYEDPMRTLHLDGTPIDAGVLEPFFAARFRILGALIVPAAVALAGVLLLATLRLGLTGVYRGLTHPRAR